MFGSLSAVQGQAQITYLTQAVIKLMADRQHPPLQAVEQTEVSQS